MFDVRFWTEEVLQYIITYTVCSLTCLLLQSYKKNKTSKNKKSCKASHQGCYLISEQIQVYFTTANPNHISSPQKKHQRIMKQRLKQKPYSFEADFEAMSSTQLV